GCRDARQLGQRYDVGIFDVDLDDGNGVALAEELTRSGLVRRAIFYTASTDDGLCAQALGFGPVINKSNGATALLEALSLGPQAQPKPACHPYPAGEPDTAVQ